MTETSTIKDQVERYTIVSGFGANDTEPEPESDEPESQPVSVQVHSVFGTLEVLAEAGMVEGHRYWLCKCQCGAFKKVKNSKLLTGHDSSCGNCDGLRKVSQTKSVLILHGTAYANGRKI